jgi:hypothetical protein
MKKWLGCESGNGGHYVNQDTALLSLLVCKFKSVAAEFHEAQGTRCASTAKQPSGWKRRIEIIKSCRIIVARTIDPS